MGNTLNVRDTRRNAGCDNDFVIPRTLQHICGNIGIEMQLYSPLFDHLVEIADGLIKFFLTGDTLRQIKLAADLRCRIKECDAVTAFRRNLRICQSRRPRADNRNLLRRFRRLVIQNCFMARARVNKTAHFHSIECMVQAGLITGNTGIDLIFPALEGLVDKLRVREHRSRHGNNIRITSPQDFLRDFRHIDAVTRDHRDIQFLPEPSRYLRKGSTRHQGGNCRHRSLMPSEMRADNIDTDVFDLLGKLDNFIA